MFQDPGRARLQEQRQRDPEAEADLAAAYRGHGSVTNLPASAFCPGPHHRHGSSKKRLSGLRFFERTARPCNQQVGGAEHQEVKG